MERRNEWENDRDQNQKQRQDRSDHSSQREKSETNDQYTKHRKEC